jgi:hypothetical protein
MKLRLPRIRRASVFFFLFAMHALTLHCLITLSNDRFLDPPCGRRFTRIERFHRAHTPNRRGAGLSNKQ